MSSALHHYREAERLLENSTKLLKDQADTGLAADAALDLLASAGHLVAKAQVHAALAQVAIVATSVLGDHYIEIEQSDVAGWVEVIRP